MGEWMPMRTAPRDGSLVLVCAWNYSRDAFYTIQAAWLVREGKAHGDWFAADTVSVNGAHPSRFQGGRETPLCWRPMPSPEERGTLKRRLGQILARKHRSNRHDR